jgi:hypothetical protein
MVSQSIQAGVRARKTCPCFGVLCFLLAFVSSLFGAKSASADTPLAALRTSPGAVPASVLGVANPYLVASAMKRPKVLGFTFSQNLVDLAHRVEKLARHGVELNQRKLTHPEKLNLRVQSRFGGGVLQLCYRR